MLFRSNFKKESIIDVGSKNTELLSQITSSYKDKTCLDKKLVANIDNIKSINANFYKWVAPQKYDVVICLQVLEHLDNPSDFAKKLAQEVSGVTVINMPEGHDVNSMYLQEGPEWFAMKVKG